MKYTILVLSLFFGEALMAKEVVCRFKIHGIEQSAEGRAAHPHQAHAQAVEHCVELKSENYQKTTSSFPSEDLFGLYIDQCTTRRCE